MNIKVKEICKGLIIAYVITMAVFCLFSILYSFTDLKDDFLPLIVRITVVISIAIGAMISCRCINSRGWINGTIVGLLYTIIMLAVGAFLEDATKLKLEVILINLSVGLFFGIVGVNRNLSYNFSYKENPVELQKLSNNKHKQTVSIKMVGSMKKVCLTT